MYDNNKNIIPITKTNKFNSFFDAKLVSWQIPPRILLNLPTGHVVQVDEPIIEEVPDGQRIQSEFETLPNLGLKVPAGHLVQFKEEEDVNNEFDDDDDEIL